MSTIIYKAGEMTAKNAQDMENGTKNPITGHKFTASFKDKLPGRRALPVYECRDDFLRIIQARANQVIVLTAATGSGKSTQLTSLLLWDLVAELKAYKMRIACTQPRRMAARGVALRVAEELDVSIGKEVGFGYRGSANDGKGTSTGETLLEYVTDGLLLAHLIGDPDLKKYRAIFIDEAHQRTMATDLLLAGIKSAQARRADLKLVVMSATIAVDGLAAYFRGCPTMDIPGRNFKVTRYFAAVHNDPISYAARTAVDLHLTEGPGAILIFVKSRTEINKVIGTIALRLETMEGPLCGEVDFVPLHAKLPQDQQDLVAMPSPLSPNTEAPGRKIIVSTNVAETSITIPGLVYVVDTCDAIYKTYNPRSTASCLRDRPASKQELAQRGGRAGRVMPGKHFHMITAEAYFSECADSTLPDMVVSDPLEAVGKELVQLRGQPSDSLFRYDLMDPPAAETVMRCLMTMSSLKLVDEDGILSPDGVAYPSLGLSPREARMLIRSGPLGCSVECATIVAVREVLDVGHDIYRRPSGDQWEMARQEKLLDESQKHWRNPRGDMIGWVGLYDAWRSVADGNRKDPQYDALADQFCDQHMFDRHVLGLVDSARARIAGTITKSGLGLRRLAFGHPLYYETLSRAICFGFFENAAFRGPKKYDIGPLKAYLTFKDQRIVHSAFPFSEIKPDYVVYDGLEQSTATDSHPYMLNVTAVRLSWLLDANSHCFDAEALPAGKLRDDVVSIVRESTGLEENFITGRLWSMPA